MKFLHKNKGKYVVRILDSKWNTYDLKPGDEVIIDKDSTKDNVEIIKQIPDEEYAKIISRIDEPKEVVKSVKKHGGK